MVLRIDFDARLNGLNQIFRAHLHGLSVSLDDDAGVARNILRIVAQPLERAFQVVFENVRHGDQVDVFIAGEQVHDSLRAAPSAAHQAGL